MEVRRGLMMGESAAVGRSNHRGAKKYSKHTMWSGSRLRSSHS